MELLQQVPITDDEIVKQVLNRYLETKQGTTKAIYSKHINKFFTWLTLNNSPTIRPDTLHSYKINLESQDLKANTINTYLAPLKDFFKWCYEMEYLPYNPAKALRSVKRSSNDTKQARNLNLDEVKAIIGQTNRTTSKDSSERILILMMFNLGLRVHEVLKVKVADIDFKDGTISVLGKGNKTRVLGINLVLDDELRKHIESCDLLPTDYMVQTVRKGMNTKPGTIQHGNNVLKRLAVKANIDMQGISSHSGRVTAINHLLDLDVSLRDVANFAGHSSVNTTRMYDRQDAKKIIQTCNIINFTDIE
jgi:site-specific recombinase XerD